MEIKPVFKEKVKIPLHHSFICSITGAGKSVTARTMISRIDAKFLIIDCKTPRDYEGLGPDIPIFIDQKSEPLMIKRLLESSSRLWLRKEFPELIELCKVGNTWEGVLEATRQKMRWKHPKTGRGVHPVVKEKLLVLEHLLGKLIKEMKNIEIVDILQLPYRINVMDIHGLSLGLQQLIVHSVLTEILNKHSNVVVVLDEAHRFCLSQDTEILTNNGWKRYDEVNTGTLVFSYNKETRELELAPIKRMIVREHNGELLKLQNQDSINTLVTEDHRVVCKTRTASKNRKFAWSKEKFVLAKELPTGFKVPVVGNFVPKSKCDIDDDLIKIMGWIITVRKRERSFGKSEETNFFLGKKASDQIRKWLEENPHRIPRIFLENASSHQLRVLFNSLVQGDGTVEFSKNGHKLIRFYCGHNSQLADDFQELCVRLGLSSVKSRSTNGQIIVRVSFRREYASIRKVSKVHYSGKVWDITIRNGAFVARRDGKVFITGNCPERKPSAARDAVTTLIKEGRAKGNFLWMSDQTITGVDKDVLKQMHVWILGCQTELNEADRILDQLTHDLGLKRRDIYQLKTGHFLVNTREWTKLAYLVPEGMSLDLAEKVIAGQIKPEEAFKQIERKEVDDLVWKEKYEKLVRENQQLQNRLATTELQWKKQGEHLQKVLAERNELLDRVASLEKQLEDLKKSFEPANQIQKVFSELVRNELERTLPHRDLAGRGKTTVELEHKELIVNLHHTGEKEVKMSTNNKEGQILYCALNDLPKEGWTYAEMNKALTERGWPIKSSTLSAKLSILAGRSILVKTKKGYRLPTKVKFDVTKT